MKTLTATELAIATQAVEMLAVWNWMRDGEPLSALGAASIRLFGNELHAEISNIVQVERLYGPSGPIANCAETRLRALRAAIKFGGAS